MIEALIAGESDPGTLAGLAHRRLKAAPQDLHEALRGRGTKHPPLSPPASSQAHRRPGRRHRRAIAGIDQEIDATVEPFRTAITLLMSLPGISDLSARVIVAAIGQDMSRFPSQGDLLSWAGLCPKKDESAGKRRSNRMRKVAPWLKTTLLQGAWAAVRKKGSYLQAQLQRLRARRGANKAIAAVAASRTHRRLPHAHGRHPLSRSRRRPLRPCHPLLPNRTPRQTSAKLRLRCPDHPEIAA